MALYIFLYMLYNKFFGTLITVTKDISAISPSYNFKLRFLKVKNIRDLQLYCDETTD